MFTKKPAPRLLVLLILPAGLLFTSVAHAQVRVEIPEARLPDAGGGLGAIMDVQSVFQGSSRSISMTVENGVKKITGSEDGIRAYIEEDPENGILVKITRQYGSGQMDLLMEEHPDLYMSMKDFPQQSEGAEVEVTLGITRSYEAASVQELREKHPAAFEIYEKFTVSDLPGGRVFGGRFGELRALELPVPRLEIRPRPRPRGGELRGRLRIDPDDVRIHDTQKEEGKKTDGKKTADKDT